MFNMFKKNDKGFTLVELMVVVLIIGILVAIAIPIFNNASTAAKKKTCDANVRTINGSISQYAATEDETVPVTGLTVATLASEDYLKVEPKCPFDDSAYAIDATSGFVTNHTH